MAMRSSITRVAIHRPLSSSSLRATLSLSTIGNTRVHVVSNNHGPLSQWHTNTNNRISESMLTITGHGMHVRGMASVPRLMPRRQSIISSITPTESSSATSTTSTANSSANEEISADNQSRGTAADKYIKPPVREERATATTTPSLPTKALLTKSQLQLIGGIMGLFTFIWMFLPLALTFNPEQAEAFRRDQSKFSHHAKAHAAARWLIGRKSPGERAALEAEEQRQVEQFAAEGARHYERMEREKQRNKDN